MGRPGTLSQEPCSPAQINAPDTIAIHQGVAPPPYGTVLRILDIPPEPADPQ